MKFTQKIEDELKKQGITAKKMLLDLGYSDNLISQWKKGSEPSAFKLQRIAQYLELSVDYLLKDEDSVIIHKPLDNNFLLEKYQKADQGIRQAVDKLLDL